MKLSKLYSNDGRFHSIEFNPGMNVVLGKVTRRYDRECDSHNLGKSTLVDLLDFMLLKDIDAKHIFRRFRDLFASHVFYLEILPVAYNAYGRSYLQKQANNMLINVYGNERIFEFRDVMEIDFCMERFNSHKV